MARRSLDKEAAERVLRRAVELGDGAADGGDQDFDPAVLVAAAADLGVPAAAVHRAVAEERAGLLDEEPSRLDRIVGPATVSAARVVGMEPAAVMGLADEWLRRVWGFRRLRTTGTVADYRRRTDVVAGMQRSARSLTGRERTERVRRLRLLVHPLDADSSIVAVVVDVGSSRALAEAGGATVATGGSALSAAAALTWVPWAWVGVGASAAAGAGVMVARRSWVQGIDVELEAVLDRVEEGRRPPSVIGGLSDRLLGG